MSPNEPTPDAAEIARRVRAGESSAVSEVEAALDAIERGNEALNAFLHVDREGALARARIIDGRRVAGEDLPPLAGVPLAVKDNLCVAGMPTTCASRILEGFVPGYSAGAVERAIEAGCVVVGKTNLDEFAMGSSTEHSRAGPSRNPWDPSRVPGGSSGGSAAARCWQACLGVSRGRFESL